MKNRSVPFLTIVVSSFILISLLGCNSEKKNETVQTETQQMVDIQRYTSLVNPFIGTDGKGKTYPGATVPFGMVQLSPDNGRGGWDWISGYFYPDTVIAGFSHTHLSGTGIGDLYDISFFPYTGTPKTDTLAGPKSRVPYSKFTHTFEGAEPGYYSVQLLDYDIRVELTATERAGFQKYTFPEGDSAAVNLNLGYARNWDSTTDAYVELVNDTLITGYRFSSGWAPKQKVYFASVLSNKAKEIIIENNGEKISAKKGNGKTLLISMKFGDIKELKIKTGISSVSEKNALENLLTEIKGWDFEEVKTQASDNWEEQLRKIEVKTSDDESLEKFYTAMYQSMLAPTIFSDVNGEYKGVDGKTHKAEGYTRYTTFSLWDTFRAEHPLLTILHPDRVPDMIKSMLAHYDEYGYLPVWDLMANETNMMIGYHAVPVIADAWLKGIRGFDGEKALDAMIKSAEADHFGLKYLNELGYIPQEDFKESVSLDLEYAYDNYCIAKMAESLGKTDIANKYFDKSEAYAKHFDKSSGFMRALTRDGSFTEPFDPTVYNDEYIEANAWQYSWFVPHNVDNLIDMHGGNEVFASRLDGLLEEKAEGDLPVFITGLIGQYVHGNEPAHHVPYLYTLAGYPEKSQNLIRKITNDLQKATPDGICGNEDCGQMSAWYIFSALGFYPVNPCGGEYIIGTPHFSEVRINLPNGNTFNITSENNPEAHYNIDSVFMDNNQIDDFRISHENITSGQSIRFVMK